MINVLIEYQYLFLQGFLTTIKLLLLIMVIGVPLGVLLGVLGGRYSRFISFGVSSLKFLTKIVPVLVLLFWLHFPLQAILGIVVDPFWTTVIALSFVNMVAVAFIVQSELKLLPTSYKEAGGDAWYDKRANSGAHRITNPYEKSFAWHCLKSSDNVGVYSFCQPYICARIIQSFPNNQFNDI